MPNLSVDTSSNVDKLRVEAHSALRGELDPLSPPVVSPKRRKTLERLDSQSASGSDNGLRGPYLATLKAQWLLRFIDFLCVNSVIPTMPLYMETLGGELTDYYFGLAGYAACLMLMTPLLGMYVDGGPGRMLKSYILTGFMSMAGCVLYALAGVVPVLAHPMTVILARCLNGIGSSSLVLCFIFAAMACEAQERQAWMVRLAVTRPLGLFLGPALGVALQSLSSAHLGFFGTCTLPGWFCCVGYAIALCLLVTTWRELPNVEDSNESEIASNSLMGFLLQGRVIAVLLVGCIGATGGMACEQSIPVVMKRLFGCSGAYCGMPMTWMAIALVVGQITILMLTKRGCQDRVLLLTGSCLVPTVFASGVILWDHGGTQLTMVVSPFLLLSFVMPYAMLGSFSTFTRLAVEDAPSHMGKIQAVQNNMLALAQVCAPMLLFWTYSGQIVKAEGTPRSCWTSLAACGLAGLLGVIVNFKSLSPIVPVGVEAKVPLLKDSA